MVNKRITFKHSLQFFTIHHSSSFIISESVIVRTENQHPDSTSAGNRAPRLGQLNVKHAPLSICKLAGAKSSVLLTDRGR